MVALTREHPLVSGVLLLQDLLQSCARGGETSIVTNAIQRPQDMVVRTGPIRSMMEAGVDVVPGTFTAHEVPDRGQGPFAKGARAGLLVSPKNLLKKAT